MRLIGMQLGLPRRSAPVIAATLAAASLAVPAITTAQQATATPPPARTFARPTLSAGQRYACPAPTKIGQMTCLSIIQSGAHSTARKTQAGQRATFGGYSPADLLKAYHLTAAAARKEHGKTVAITDAFADPRAAVDLARYRRMFHLPPCTVASGCLRIVNQKGNSEPLPIPDQTLPG